MERQRPFRFAVGAAHFKSHKSWTEYVRKVEAFGYSTLTMPDHLGNQFAPLLALMAAAEITSQLRLGTFVLDNDYRHPVLLAKEAATLDKLSGGRLELGIGAGWMRSEYEKAGIHFDAPNIRIERLEETIHIIKGLFSEGPFSYNGSYYTVTDLDGKPKPIQQPRPPILIGGGGKRLLALAAREADTVGLGPRTLADGSIDKTDMTIKAIAKKVDWVRQAAGERFEALELNIIIFTVIITDNLRGTIERIASNIPNLNKQDILDSPHLLIGTIDNIIEKLQALRASFGISYIKIPAQNMMAFSPIISRIGI